MISHQQAKNKNRGWYEVVDAGKLSEVKEWQRRLEAAGATTKIQVVAQSGGKYGPKRVFVLWTDAVGAKFFSSGTEYLEESDDNNFRRVKWDSWSYSCYDLLIGD